MTAYSKSFGVAVGALMVLIAAGHAFADTLPVKGGTASVDVSATQMTRVFVRDDKIVASRNLSDPNGPQLLTQSDQTTGDLYIGFDGDAVGRTYSIYVTTQSGEVIQLVLKPTQIDPTSIELLEEHHRSQGNSAPGVPKTNGYAETLIAFEKVMFNNDLVDGVTYQPVNDGGQETKHFFVRTLGYYHADGLTGTVLSLSNHSTVPQQLTDEQFLVRNVLAVGVTQDIVQPGQEVRVFVVEQSQ